jgi:hypothetical protein
MVEVAISYAGLSIDAAWDLDIADYRLLMRARRRMVRDEHDRDLRNAWMIAAMVNRPISYRQLERLLDRRGIDELARDEDVRSRVLATFEDHYQAEKHAEALAAKGAR